MKYPDDSMAGIKELYKKMANYDSTLPNPTD